MKRISKAKESTERFPQMTYFNKEQMDLINAVRDSFGLDKPSMASLLRTLVLEAIEVRSTDHAFSGRSK